MKLETSSGKSQVGALLIGKFLAMLATFIMPMFLTRFLPKADYGIYSQYYIVLFFLSSFFSLGLQSNLYYFYPVATQKKQRQIIIQTFYLLLCASLIATVLLLIPAFSDLLIGNSGLENYKALIIIGILLLIPVGIIEPLYVIKNDRKTSLIYPALVVIIRLIFVVIFALLYKSLLSIFIGFLFSSFLTFVFIVYYIGKDFYSNKIEIFSIDLKLLKTQLKYSLPFGLAVSINAIISRIDKLVCIKFLTSTEFATYSVAFFSIPAIQQIYDSFTQVYLVKMSRYWQENNISEVITILNTLVYKTYSYTIPAILLSALYAKKIIVLIFTDQYLDSVPLFRLYIISFIFTMMGTGLVLRCSGNTNMTLKSYLYSSIIIIPATYYLIKYYGVYGGISGALLSIIFPKLMMIYYEIKILNSSLIVYFPFRKVFKILVVSTLSIIPLLIIELKFQTSLIVVVFLAIIYLILVSSVLINKGLFVLDLSEIRQIIKKYSIS